MARIHPTTFVAPGAVVVGDVALGARTSVWFNTVVRADSAAVTVGDDTNLQDSTVVHEDEGFPTMIGARVTVGHRSIIHGCVIGDECLVGMGSIVLSGARIGPGSLIGAGALVREGQVTPPGSLVVGAPARVVGEVSEAHRVSIRNGWSHYAELASEYLRRGLAHPLDRSGAILQGRPPTDEGEWVQLLKALREIPDRISALAAHASQGGQVEAVGRRLMDCDRRERHGLLDRMEAGTEVPMFGGGRPLPAQEAQAADLGSWSLIRASLCERLNHHGPRSGLRVSHPTRGPFSLPHLVREWVDEDMECMRGIDCLESPGP